MRSDHLRRLIPLEPVERYGRDIVAADPRRAEFGAQGHHQQDRQGPHQLHQPAGEVE
jgi:hypothetical protein